MAQLKPDLFKLAASVSLTSDDIFRLLIKVHGSYNQRAKILTNCSDPPSLDLEKILKFNKVLKKASLKQHYLVHVHFIGQFILHLRH